MGVFLIAILGKVFFDKTLSWQVMIELLIIVIGVAIVNSFSTHNMKEKKKRGHTMRALLVALLLMFDSPARADDAELKLCGCSGRVVSMMQCIGSGSASNSTLSKFTLHSSNAPDTVSP